MSADLKQKEKLSLAIWKGAYVKSSLLVVGFLFKTQFVLPLIYSNVSHGVHFNTICRG